MTDQGSGGPFDRILKPEKGKQRGEATQGPKPERQPRRERPRRESPQRPPDPQPARPRPRPAAAESRAGAAAGGPSWLSSERTPYLLGGVIIAFALLLWVFFLPPFSIFGGDGDGGFDLGGGIRAVPQDSLPDVPEGLTPVSQFFRIVAPDDALVESVTIDLNQQTDDGANLGFYTYGGGNWSRLRGAELVNDGRAVRAAIGQLPENLAVMRNVNFGFVVAGWLPAGGEVEPAAVETLTTLNPIDYHPAADGSVTGIPTDITNAGSFAIAPTISAETPDQIDALNTIIRSGQLSATHVDAIVALIEQGGYSGIDLDYRQLDPALGAQFSEFVVALANRLHENEWTLSLTLPLPIRDANSWDTGPFNWAQLGEAADRVKIPAISDQSIYAARMDSILQFATGEVPSNKLLLVISPYSYISSASENEIVAVHAAEALSLATPFTVEDPSQLVSGGVATLVAENVDHSEGASGIRWDEEANVVSFAYGQDENLTTVWIENQYSVAFKLQLVRKHRLGGVAVLDVSASPLKANIWPAIASVVDGQISLLKPNGQLLIPAWEIIDPNGSPVPSGSLDGGATGAVEWRIPGTAGPYDVTLVVSDGDMRVGQRLRVNVTQGAGAPTTDGDATPTGEGPQPEPGDPANTGDPADTAE